MSADSGLSLADALMLLKVDATATGKEIRKSYRSLSLLYHPDKAKDVPAERAADRFDKLHKAYELLSDPIIREKLAKQAAEEDKRKERVGKFEAERKKMSQALEKREREEAQRRNSEKEALRQREIDLENLKAEGKRMREQKSQARTRQLEEEAARLRDARYKAEEATKSAIDPGSTNNSQEPPLGPLDSTIRLLYPSAIHISLSATLKNLLLTHFGPLTDLRYIVPQADGDEATAAKKRKRSDEVTCLATFDHLSSALLLIESASDFRLAEATSAHGLVAEELDQVWVEWAAAKEIARKRKEARKQGKPIEGSGTVDEAIGGKVGEPAQVTWWRLRDPERLSELLRGKTFAIGRTDEVSVKASTTTARREDQVDFEAEVLRKAMAAAEAKRRTSQGDVEVGK